MSRGWLTAAIVFFFASCCFGGLLMAGLKGPEGIDSQEWKEAFGPKDAGAAEAPSPDGGAIGQ